MSVDLAQAELQAAALPSTEPLLRVRDLQVHFTGRRPVHAVRGLDLEIVPGEAVAIVGESGSGKSVTARTLVGLAGQRAQVEAAEFSYGNLDARRLSESAWRKLRGRRVGLVLQDALNSPDPLRTIRQEISEVVINHRLLPHNRINERVLESLRSVGFPNPELRADQ